MSPAEGPKGPSCHDCRHFYVTHDPSAPHGCRAYGFKSAAEPAQVVWQSSGLACQLHRARVRSGKTSSGAGGRYI